MKYTMDMLVKLEKGYEQKRQDLLNSISSYSTFVAAVTENKEDAAPEFNLDETVSKINLCLEAVLELKHIKNSFNNTKEIEINGVKMTLDTAIVRLAMLNREYSYISNLANKKDKIRVGSRGFGSSKSSDIEYTYLNYDLSTAVKLEKEMRTEIADIKIAINYAMSNSEVEFTGTPVDEI